MRLPLPCCCFIPAWLTLHGMACQAVLLHEHGLNARVLASGAQCSSGVCWYLMWGESGCAVPSLGLGGQQQVRQEWTPRAPLPTWAWGRQADCSLWAVGCRGSPGAR